MTTSTTLVRGILFRCTLRAGHASLAIVVTGISPETAAGERDEDEGEVRISGSATAARDPIAAAAKPTFAKNDEQPRCVGKGRNVAGGDFDIDDNHNGEGRERMLLVIVRFGGSDWGGGARRSPKEGDDEEGSAEAVASDADEGDCAVHVNKNREEAAASAAKMRSTIRRMCKLGNEMEFEGCLLPPFAKDGDESQSVNQHSSVATAESASTTNAVRNWQRFLVDDGDSEHNDGDGDGGNEQQPSPSSLPMIRVHREGQWDAKRCQAAQGRYFPAVARQRQEQQQQSRGKNAKVGDQKVKSPHSGGGVGKRRQGEIVADFLVRVLLSSKSISCGGGGGFEGEAEALSSESNGVPDASSIPEDGEGTKHHLWMDQWTPMSTESSIITAKMNSLVAEMASSSMTNNSGADRVDDGSTGVIDAAGGAGHVSLALALRGIRSTVVDPRPTAGRLPGRDRKTLKKALRDSMKAVAKRSETDAHSGGKVVPFSTHRAWFGCKPEGADMFYREGTTTTTTPTTTPTTTDSRKEDGVDTDSIDTLSQGVEKICTEEEHPSAAVVDDAKIPICSMCSEDKLLPRCVAIVALHPDEATGAIVEIAVRYRVPFVVVPCCVFSRLFPRRFRPKMAIRNDDGVDGCGDSGDESGAVAEVGVRDDSQGSGDIVSTYHDLIDWLVSKHPAIRVTRLPFDGANLAVWATFS